MNLYYVTLWDPDGTTNGVKTGTSLHLSIVAKNAGIALRMAGNYHGEITAFTLQQTGLLVV